MANLIFYFKKCREIIKKIFLFLHLKKMSFAKLRISPPKKREKTTASYESSPFWFFFYNPKLPKTTLLGPSHGGPARFAYAASRSSGHGGHGAFCATQRVQCPPPSGIVRPAQEHSSSLRRYSHSLALSLPASLCLELRQ